MAQAKKIKQDNEDRLGLRLSADLKKKVDYAALLRGVPTAGFVKEVLAEAANKAIREQDFIELSKQDREAFTQALLNPPEPSAKSLEAARRYKKRLAL